MIAKMNSAAGIYSDMKIVTMKMNRRALIIEAMAIVIYEILHDTRWLRRIGSMNDCDSNLSR